MEPSQRFIAAYNEADTLLHEIADARPQVPFTETIRLASAHNAVVNRYADDLYSFGRLRNAIVHSSRGDRIIAEPHPDVVDELERIVHEIKEPPRARDVLGERKVICVSSRSPLIDAVRLIAKYSYSNIPVVTCGKVNGLLTPKDVVVGIGAKLAAGDDLDGWLSEAKVTDLTRKARFAIVKDDVSVVAAMQAFEDPKLKALIVTTTGTDEGEVKDIITSGDLVRLNAAVVKT